MEYDFTCTDTLTAVRFALKRTINSFSSRHYSIVCETKTRNITFKLWELAHFINTYKYSDDYELISAYIASTGSRNVFHRLDNKFISSLKKRNFTIQDVLYLLKQISLTTSELEQEIREINENYFSNDL